MSLISVKLAQIEGNSMIENQGAIVVSAETSKEDLLKKMSL